MKAIVEIKGGFGNQIFQYIFCNHLKEQGYRVSVNLQNNIRGDSILKPSQFGFKQTSKVFVWLFQILYQITMSKKNTRLLTFFINKYFNKYYDLKSFKLSKKKFLNYFDGYWQDMDIFTQNKKYLIESLSKINELSQAISSPAKKGSTLLHIRRGDYLNVKEELEINYYEEAVKICKRQIENFTFEIFTDDIVWVQEQEIFKEAAAVHGPSNNSKELLTDICKMFKFENFIISNSSFSLVIASLSEKKQSTIVVPDPWMKHANRDLNLDKSWIKLKNF